MNDQPQTDIEKRLAKIEAENRLLRAQLESLTPPGHVAQQPQPAADEAVTPASQWRAPAPTIERVRLPSGNVVEIKQPSLADLLSGSGLPDPVGGTVARMIEAAQGGGLDNLGNNPQQMGEAMQMINALVTSLVVRPRIVEEPQGDDEITLAHLSLQDRTAIVQRVFEVAAAEGELFRT